MSPRKSTMKRKNGKKMKGGGGFWDWVPSLLGSKKQEDVPQAQPQDQKPGETQAQAQTTVPPKLSVSEGMKGGRKRKSSKRKTQKNKSR